MPKPNPWRLSRTLARKPEISPLQEGEIFYAWAAYKAGAFADVFKPDLSAVLFKACFTELLNGRWDAAWVMRAHTKKGFIPAGLALGFWPHRVARPFMVLDALIWFPWASSRNKIEATVEFTNKARAEIPMIAFVRSRDKKFMEMLARHGIVRRIGTSNNVFADGPASVWETTHKD